MPATFFVGDLHFGHELVSGIRGFKTTGQHDLTIIRKWHKQVKPDDKVYVTGDISGGGAMAEGYALSILAELPGRKWLISGNHDSTAGQHKRISPNKAMFDSVFEKISDHSHISWEGRKLLISHYPYWESQDGPERGHGRYQEWRLPDLGHILIHAHTHYTHPTSGSATGREICTSWDAWNRLADMGDISRLIKKMESTSLAEYKRKLNLPSYERPRHRVFPNDYVDI